MAYIEENQQVWLRSTSPSPADGIDRTDQRLGRDGMYNDHGSTGAGYMCNVLNTGINTRHTEFTGRIGGVDTAASAMRIAKSATITVLIMSSSVNNQIDSAV